MQQHNNFFRNPVYTDVKHIKPLYDETDNCSRLKSVMCVVVIVITVIFVIAFCVL